jgi:FixJ family two-component response regulator
VPCVAIVDDEEGIRKALSRLLRASGLEAESYANGQEFLDAAAEHRPDCVVLDLHMPGMSGLQVLRKLKAAGQRLSIVVITAHDEPETRERCIDAGACAYLRKPLEDRLLLNAISAAMRSHSAPIKR